MAIGAGAALLATALASFIPRHRPAGTPAGPVPADGAASEPASVR
ncbi:hypothetical protein ACN6LI_004934 [Streptomyces violaceoruber]